LHIADGTVPLIGAFHTTVKSPLGSPIAEILANEAQANKIKWLLTQAAKDLERG
jgi:hypothetical protein